ncbi:hypothetical protein AGMMS49949_07320 [Alphaproteobacteria bacterium]|nr:hypothetical protein AGMMS49949_07320 [Alphaproteobacteria bacterium]
MQTIQEFEKAAYGKLLEKIVGDLDYICGGGTEGEMRARCRDRNYSPLKFVL